MTLRDGQGTVMECEVEEERDQNVRDAERPEGSEGHRGETG